MKYSYLMLTLFLTSASAQHTQPKPDTDWEGALADYMQAKGQAEMLGLWEALQRPDPAEARKRWDFLAAQFPTSASTAKLAASRCAELAEAQRWEELLTAVPDLVRRYPDYPSTHNVAITALERVVTKTEVPEALRLKALRTLVPLVKQRVLVVRACLAALTKLNLPDDERYRLGCALEESCGTSPGMRGFRWRMVELLARAASPEVVRAACEAFSKRYGTEHTEGRSAERLLLTLEKTPEAKKRLAGMAKEDNELAAQLKAALAATQQALAIGVAAEVNSALAPLAAIQPAYAVEATWSTLVQSKEFAAAPLAARLVLLESLFEHTQAGAAQASAISVGVNLGRSQPAALKAVVKHLLANTTDAQQAFAQFSVLQRFVRDAKDEELLRETYHAGASMARKLGVTDREVEYLTEFAQLIWDRDETAAKEALQSAARYWPRIPAAAQAGWFLAFLEGKLGVVQGALPREFKAAVNADAPLPVLAMPKLPAAPSSCVTQGDAVEMAKADVKQNFLSGQLATHSDGAAATNAVTDGDATTLWRPAKMPAALLVPLRKTATVERIRVQFTAPAYFVITLRDAKGQALSKVERDWGFWEHMRNTIHWPNADTTLNITPLPDVAAIEVQVFDGIGEVGLVELEAFSSPYPATTRHDFAAQDIEAGAKRVRVTLDAVQPEVTTTIHADKESTRGFPIMRWLKPWTRSMQPVILRTLNENIGVEFWGDSALATIGGTGGARWSLDGQAVQESAPVKVTGAVTRELLIGGQTGGRHLLRLQSTNLPAAHDEGGYNDLKLHQLSVKGRAVVRPLLRFINAKGESGDWQQPTEEGSAAVPEKVSGEKTTRVQVAAFFDSRGAAGTATATVRGMKLAFDNTAAAPAADFTSHAPSALPEQLDAVLAGVRAREAVVVYAKTGTNREHAAAKALAERAGLYLVSDDIGLNRYSSPVIAVGTPLRHRYCRQLLATAGLWNDAAYLNDEDGVIGIERDEQGRPATFYITGETPEAVVKAVERLLAKMPPRTEAPRPFRTFASHTLEMIYPWQLRGQGTPPALLEVRLGIQDRRSAQFGIAAEVPLGAVTIECSALTSAAGKTIPKVLVQTVGNYEWVPFFGDLRLPNLLVPNAPFSLPAHSSIGVWLTAITDAATLAGEYRGTLKVTAAGKSQDVPVRVVVEPVALPNSSEVGTYSFASVPYWFHQGTEIWKRSLRELAANEAAQDVNTVSPVFHVELKPARHTLPLEMAVGPADSRADSLKWQPHSADAKDIAAGGALFLRFAKAVQMRDIAAVLKPAEDARFILAAASASGEWTTAAEPTRQLCASWDERNRPRSQAQPEVLRFRVKPGTMNAAVWRITSQNTGAFAAHSALALTAEDGPWPFTADFTHFDEQMDIYEGEYRAQQRPLPVFLSQIHPDALLRMSNELFGIGAVGDTASWFAEMMVERLGKTGRAKRFIAKVDDEPRDLVRWAQSAQPYRDGGLQTMTAHNTSYPDMNVGSGLINPWCPNYEHEVWKPFFHERRKQGDKVWWYECGIPSTRITGTPIDNMPFYWLTAKWRMDGAMNYAALHANKGSSMPLAFRYEHGMDHRMAHEKNGRLLDTTRRELEGDGIRDVKLITWVRHRLEALKPTRPDRAKQLEQRLDAAIESVAPYRYGYPQDPARWFQARNTVYDIAVEVVN